VWRNVPVITCNHSPRWFILPLDPAHEKKPTRVERERIEKAQPKKKICVLCTKRKRSLHYQERSEKGYS
jgi:hypothetical protein